VRTYETLFIVNPDLDESEISKTIDMVQDIITAGGGNIMKVDKWGRRQLAYIIQNKRDGYYVVIYFEGPQTILPELNRRYKLATDTIMRSLVLQLKKEQFTEMLESGSSLASPKTAFNSENGGEYDDDNVYTPTDKEELVASTEE
jgi:small subunit ribosomal protein S6